MAMCGFEVTGQGAYYSAFAEPSLRSKDLITRFT